MDNLNQVKRSNNNGRTCHHLDSRYNPCDPDSRSHNQIIAIASVINYEREVEESGLQRLLKICREIVEIADKVTQPKEVKMPLIARKCASRHCSKEAEMVKHEMYVCFNHAAYLQEWETYVNPCLPKWLRLGSNYAEDKVKS